MEDSEITECLALMDGSVGMPTNVCPVCVNYKPIVIPGLVYQTIIAGGFLQLMMTNDQYASSRFNSMIKYYEEQRKEAIEYLRKVASNVAQKRLVVPQEEFLRWMRDGRIDTETYLILRNCVLKKGYNKRVALKKEIEEAKRMLAPVGKATSVLISKVDVKDFSKAPQPKTAQSPRPVEISLSKTEVLIKSNPGDPCPLPPYKQAICGAMFGLLAAKVFCSFLLRMMPPKVESSIT